ncbi:hypothetical protein C8J57DRAFT_1512057 [Mycena rebaudengoi]|nr:hypothetical protein C8J57DRAFT_1512057 [Mycena rebaudengoi]
MSGCGAPNISLLTASQISQATAGRQQAISAHFPPTLTPLPTLLETVSFIDAATETRMMRIRLGCYPIRDLILCRRLHLRESPSLPDLLRMGAREMQEGPFNANIVSLVNKGNPRANGVSYLTSRHPFRLDTTNFNGDQ